MTNIIRIIRLSWKMQWRGFLGKTDRKKKSALITYAILGVFFLALEVLLSVGLANLGTTLAPYRVSTEIITILLLAASTLTLLFALLPMLNTLYFNKDAQFYLTMPVQPSAVFAAKAIVVYINEILFTAALVFVPLLVYGIAAQLSFTFYIGILVAILVVPTVPMFVGSIICIPLMYLVSFFRSRSLLGGLIGLLVIGALFGLYFYAVGSLSSSAEGGVPVDWAGIAEMIRNSMSKVRYVFLPLYAIAAFCSGSGIFGVAGAGGVALSLAIAVAVPLVLFILAYLLARVFFRRSISAQQESKRTERKRGSDKSVSFDSALIKREFKTIFRTPTTMISYFLPMLFSVLLPVFMWFVMRGALQGDSVEAAFPADAMLRMIMFAMVGMMSVTSCSQAMMAYSREGKSMATILTLPIAPKKLLRIKMIVACLPGFAGIALGSVVSLILSRVGVEFILPYLVYLGFMSYFFVCYAVRQDLKAPNFNWTSISELQSSKKKVFASLLLIYAMMFLTMIVCAVTLLIPEFYPEGSLWVPLLTWIVCIGIAVGLAIWQHLQLFRNAERWYSEIEI